MDTMLLPQPELEQEIEPIRILVIDDDQDQVKVLQYHLSSQGFTVTIAHTAKEGKRRVKEDNPNLILLDIELPDATGFEICQEITDNPSTFQIPIIFVSGAECENVLRTARSAGCAFYVRKPYDPNVLLVLIKQTLEQSSY